MGNLTSIPAFSIPAKPVVLLANILEQMCSKRRPGDDCVRIYGVRDFLRNKFSYIPRYKLAQEIEVSYKNLTNWIGNSNRDIGVPLPVFLNLCRRVQKSPDEIFSLPEVKFGCTNSKKYSLPQQVSPSLAYLLGYLMGDGHLANPNDTISNGSQYNAEIRITTGEKSDLIFLRELFLQNFGYAPNLYQEGSFYRLVGRSKVIHKFLVEILGFPTGNKKRKTAFPLIVMENPELRKWFLIGFFDADGCISSVKLGENRYWSITIKQFKRSILCQCNAVLKERGINISGIYIDRGIRKGTKTKSYVLAIRRKREVDAFVQEFPSLKIARCSIYKKKE